MVETGRRKNPGLVSTQSAGWSDSGWVGAGPGDDLDERLEAEMGLFDETRPHVLTLLGPIEPESLGVTLIGGWDRPLVAGDVDTGAVLLEHEQLYAIGVRALVDLASALATGAWSDDLAWLSERTPVHTISARPMEQQGTAGDPRHARAGALTIASPEELVPDRDPRTLPIFARGPAEAIGYGQVPTDAVALKRAIVVGPVLGRQAGEWAAVLGWAGYAGLLIPGGGEDQAAAAEMVRNLVERGPADRLLLGYQDDPFAVMERFPLALMAAGLPADAVRAMLVDNPARALTITPA